MARTIDADKAIEVAQIKYNDWNLAMAAADGRREINLCFKKQELFKAVKAVLDCVPTLTQPNEPLALEQLREMDGEPVWIVDIGGRNWYGPGWAIVDRENNLVRTVKNWNPVFFERYGERWLAYRRPPEGETNA